MSRIHKRDRRDREKEKKRKKKRDAESGETCLVNGTENIGDAVRDAGR